MKYVRTMMGLVFIILLAIGLLTSSVNAESNKVLVPEKNGNVFFDAGSSYEIELKRGSVTTFFPDSDGSDYGFSVVSDESVLMVTQDEDYAISFDVAAKKVGTATITVYSKDDIRDGYIKTNIICTVKDNPSSDTNAGGKTYVTAEKGVDIYDDDEMGIISGIDYKTTLKYPKEYTFYIDDGYKIKSVKSSKKAVVKIADVDTRYFEVKATGGGTSYLSLITYDPESDSTYQSEIKCTVKGPKKTNKVYFYAALDDYRTRSNCFIVKIRNNSTKNLYITSGVKVINDRYKAFDRKIYLKKSVKLKPYKTKYVKFYVKGSNTDNNTDEFTLKYKFKFNGKNHIGRVRWCKSDYKVGGKWKYTYPTNEDDAYEDWR